MIYPNCWENDYGAPSTFTIYNYYEEDSAVNPSACDATDTCEAYIDPGSLNGMCVNYSPPSPGCPEQVRVCEECDE